MVPKTLKNVIVRMFLPYGIGRFSVIKSEGFLFHMVKVWRFAF